MPPCATDICQVRPAVAMFVVVFNVNTAMRHDGTSAGPFKIDSLNPVSTATLLLCKQRLHCRFGHGLVCMYAAIGFSCSKPC